MQILTGAAALVLSAPLLAAQAAPPAQPAGPAPASTPLPTDPVPQLAQTLADSTKTPAQRDEAASQLVARATHKPLSPAAVEALQRGLTGGHDQQLAVAHAIAGSTDPDPQWIAPLTQLLGSERQIHDAAARALTRFGDDATARDALIAFANDEHHTAPERAAAAEALGSFVDKAAAEALVGLLENPGQPAAIADAAAEALRSMTGITDNDDDPTLWRKWMTTNAGLSDEQWKAQVYPGHAQRMQELEIRQKALATEVDTLLTDDFQNTPDARKNKLVMRYLNSPAPDVRAIGARIVRDAVKEAQPFPPEAPGRLAELVGDSDAKVRLAAAQALQVLPAPALDALLQQLAIETHADVKIALLGAIGPDDPRALPVVRKLLHDPSIVVAIAAAQTIRQLGPKVYGANPALARETAEELWKTINLRAGEPRAAEFKAAAIEAMAPLKDAQQSTEFPKLLKIDEPEPIRTAALHALRELGDKNTSDVIASWLASEPNASLRADAIEALNTTGNFVDDAQVLYDHTKAPPAPGAEPDQAVRDKAWFVWDSLLGECTDINTLNNWRHTMFHDGNVQQHIAVLNVLNDNLLKQNQLSDLAISQQETGDAYMQTGRPEQAATHYQSAWDYYAKQNKPDTNTPALLSDLMKAYLQSKQYDKAVDFGQGVLGQDPQAVGNEIRESVDQLSINPATRADALKLIDLALKMNPGIPELYHQDLVATQKQLSGDH